MTLLIKKNIIYYHYEKFASIYKVGYNIFLCPTKALQIKHNEREKMPNNSHKILIQKITELDRTPSESEAFSNWIQAEAHLEFMKENKHSDEVLIYASGEYTVVNSVIVPNLRLYPINQDDIMRLNFNSPAPIARYQEGGRNGIKKGLLRSPSKTMQYAIPLFFIREFNHRNGPGRNYFELNQEYAHVSKIHWHPEKNAYCREGDELGSMENVASITNKEDKGMNLISFKREPLGKYLLATNTSLVRIFDFTLLRRPGFYGWLNEAPKRFYISDNFFYDQYVMPGHGAYTRGVQIIRSLSRLHRN